MKKIRILKTETTEKDEILRALIGSVWYSYEKHKDSIVIDCCGGVKLHDGEYETV